MTRTTAIRAADFTASVGVNASINYTDGKYVNIQNVLSDLNYIGVSLIRTAAYWVGMQGQAAYNLAASKGIRFDMLLYTNNTLANSIAQMSSFSAAHPGALVAIEGPNEINNFGASYKGMTGAAAAVAFQNDLYAGIRADKVLKATTVYSYTMNAGASSTTGYDYAAIHPYGRKGLPPLSYLKGDMASIPGNKPFAVTETGYSTLTTNIDGVDPLVQAKYDLDMIFDAKKAGASTVFLYELLDAYADPNGTDPGKHYGLFDYGNAPKPIATALHNLMQILGDSAASAGSFTTGVLDYTIFGADKTASNYLMQKSSGVFDLVVWNEQTIWNATTKTEVAAVPDKETIRFARVQETVKVYDPLAGTDPIKVWHNVSQITVTVTDHPLVVEVTKIASQTNAINASRGMATIHATAKGSVIVGGPGDQLYAGAGADTFVFHKGFGHEDVFDFDALSAKHDTVQFDSSLFADYAAVTAAMHQVGSDVVITHDAAQSVVLHDVSLSALSAADFLLL
ncbi:putative calcium binding protein [Novosphingobium nitrogenifigens DSM 19370]|uniref:Putative calcium binding protein n=1 Tax=Novosphingobium nitrogenifigens DSM 19370 TaxID=983920 RepID=F1Z4A5_9SPHN|nr:hypothetical protein [Novosphingobium nitrogenifigens]EGD60515.1 putative calcium binding protein [Novosphingobium nitrogenifigens DSM 19370]